MSAELFKRLKQFRQLKKISISELCQQIGAHYTTYHRWKNSGKITGPYKKIVEEFLNKNNPSQAASKAKSTPFTAQINSSDIAVIGISCYYPGASNVLELWENILARRVQFRRMLDQRLPLSEYYDADPKSPEKTYLTKAAFLENFQFDWGKLRIPKKTVESTDIAHWLALDVALKTFQDAGYKLNEIPLQNTGVIVGNTLTGEQTRSQTLRLRWPFVQKALNATLAHLGKSIEERSQIASEMEKIYKSAFYPVTEDSLAGGLANTIAGRICNYLNLKGGGYIVDGACSSSLLAVATAADALKMGNMDIALAGGVDISLDPFELVGFSKAGALAKDQMRVYDKQANGFLPGEGCGFVLLKRLNDAIRDKNYIYAVIKGWGISSDGKGGIMEPSSSGQSFAIGRAYKDLEYKISDVNFVEGHGTGTTKGDRVELEGIATAIEKTVTEKNKELRNCGVTSFKSIVGHTKAAAGIGGLIKAILGVNQRVLPPTASCTEPNEVFQDKAKNLYPIIQGGFIGDRVVARAGVSSAGFGGINCHITVESKDKPKPELKPNIDERALFVNNQQTEVFVFASRTIIHLKMIIEKFKEDLRNISIAEMADLACLLNKKVKNTLPVRAAIVTDTPEHLYEALLLLEQEIDANHLEEGKVHKVKSTDLVTRIIISIGVKKARLGFLYPGQGSQRLNMTRTLVERYEWARDLLKLSKLPINDYVYKSTDKYLTKEDQQVFEKQLSDTRITQPAIVLSSLIWTEFLSKLGIEPQCVAGHSLGELTAFYKAGAFNKEILVKFAQMRGELMFSSGSSTGSMVSLFCSKDKAEELIKKVSGNIVIANFNSPSQMIASGGNKEVDKLIELAKKEEINATRLNVSNAFHTSFMKRASEKIRSSKILPETFKSRGSVGVYSSMGGIAIDGNIDLKEYFAQQMISPVNFISLIDAISKDCDLFIEVGPGRVLTDLVKAINKEIVCLPIESSTGNDRDLNFLLAELFTRNIPIKWDELYNNRLIRTFVPASRKKFIENQCEHPLKIDNQVIKSNFLPVLLEAKAEAKEIDEIIPGGLPGVEGKNHIADLLINLTHEITGFELESISLNLKLLDDLNMDSIKAAELIGQAARKLGIAGQVDPSQLSNNTLAQISERLQELIGQANTSPSKETLNDILKRYKDKSWVRNFVSTLKTEEIKTKNVNQFKELKNIVILSEKGDEALIKSLEGEFKSPKVNIRKTYFNDPPLKQDKASVVDCLIAVLPKGEINGQLDKLTLKNMMNRLHQIVELAHSHRLNKNSFVVFVQFGGGYFGEGEGLNNIASCCSKSFASTLFLERPELKVRAIDFDERIPNLKIPHCIIDELQTYEQFSVAGYDNQMIRRIVNYENSYPANYKKRGISWSDKDIVLVTGGAKGITAQCALEFARLTRAKMVLIGRSPKPENMKDDSSEIVGTIRQFERENLKCDYYQCDVANEMDVEKTISEIEKKLGKITGVIHGAGLNSLKRLKQASLEESFKETLPKVMGAVHICRALKKHPPKLFVGITSIIGLTGMEGSGWYGFSNEVLNLYLHKIFSSPQVVTIAYSVWDEVGMGAKLGSVNRLAERGIGAIPVDEGIERFGQLVMGDPGCQQVIVAARIAGIATWKSADPIPNNFRFLEKVEYFLPGVELIARATLNTEDDPYLLDHNWKGSLLFPFVFGFEAMAQAVAYVLGLEKLEQIKARNIDLQRPISVLQNVGTVIEIHAQVMDEKENNNQHQVKVEIYSQDTAFKEPHFSAVFEIDSNHNKLSTNEQNGNNHKYSKLKKPLKNVDIDMQTDIYGPILFQGKSFQCIDQIHELYYDEKAKKGECIFTSIFNNSTNKMLNKNKFNNNYLLGDPYFIDSVLQSMQLIIPRDISLPNEIQEIYLINSLGALESKFLSYSNIRRTDPNYYLGDAEIINDKFLLIIKNCRLKILDTILTNPSANDLSNLAKRDQKTIEKKLAEFSNEIDFSLPFIRCFYDNRLKTANKKLRHKIERPLINSAVGDFLKKENKLYKKFRVEWLRSGKPVIVGESVKGIGLSISHNNTLLIVIVGYGEQGCDIESYENRSKTNWVDLLGNEKAALFDEILNKNKQIEINYAGASIWSLNETLKKVGNNKFSDFKIIKFENECLFFQSINSDNGVVFFQFKSQNKIKYISIFIKIKNLVSFQNGSELNYLQKISFDKDIFGFELDYTGPQNQIVFTKRFPVTFRASQMLSRKVYFTNYFEWMGEVREYTGLAFFKEIYKMSGVGGWGMATNYTKLEVLDEVEPGEVIEVRIWQESIINNVLNLKYDWRKINSNGNRSRIALSQMGFSWLKILGHGLAKIEPLPNVLKEFFDGMLPKTNFKKSIEILPSKYKSYDIGEVIFKDKNIIKNRIPVYSQVVSTTTENSNFIGNIYFANYGEWMGQVRDSYLYNLNPRYFQNFGKDGEWICLDCSIDHLSEAMPYDNILIKMYIETTYRFGFDFLFEYFLFNGKKIQRKLAIAKHKVVLIKRDVNNNPALLELSENLLHHYQKNQDIII